MKNRIDLEELTVVVQQMKEGSSTAPSKFYDLTCKTIYRFTFLLSKNEQQALDLCHDTFVKALSSINKLKDNRGALAWLFQIARHSFLDYKKKKKEEYLEDYQEPLSGGISEEWLQVRQALSSLPDEERTMLILIDMEGFSYQEAGSVLGVTEDSIRMKIFRARQHFLELYK